MRPLEEDTENIGDPTNDPGRVAFGPLLGGVLCFIAAYGVVMVSSDRSVITIAFVVLALIFAAICFLTPVRRGEAAIAAEDASNTESIDETEAVVDNVPASELQSEIMALEEAATFFGGSLNASDMYRLITARIGAVVPHQAGILYSGDGEWQAVQFHGGVPADAPPPSEDLSTDPKVEELSPRLNGFGWMATIPLFTDDHIFGVLRLFSENELKDGPQQQNVLREVGKRIAPIFSRSLAFEKNISNSLIDPVTGLPNERSFFMILENQLAESHRYRDDRPLTVLALDIKDFEAVNRRYGHAAGDNVLKVAGRLIGEQLRKMDMLARTLNDEFVVVLPTAGEKTALDIVERIKKAFADHAFQVTKDDEVKIWLNFGWATFWKDGETSGQLLRQAQLIKQRSKTSDQPNVLFFPKEYVN